MKINEKNLCVFASSPPFDCEGFLNKRGEVNKSFQPRYFVLKGNLLFYFEKKGDKEPLGLIIVEGCTIELSEESGDQYCFEIAFNGNRTYILSANSQESMESWMKALTCAGYEYKKLMVAELQRQLEEIEGCRNKILNEANATAAAATASVPRPPPRRQNPFNRPAPPLPLHGLNGNGNSGTTFINGHFGSTSPRGICYHPNITTHTDVNTSPIPPPRVSQSGASSKSQFYLEQQQQQKQTASAIAPTVFPPSAGASASPLPDLRNPKANNAAFEEIHERFRQLVMKDVQKYREQRQLKARPLIEF